MIRETYAWSKIFPKILAGNCSEICFVFLHTVHHFCMGLDSSEPNLGNIAFFIIPFCRLLLKNIVENTHKE